MRKLMQLQLEDCVRLDFFLKEGGSSFPHRKRIQKVSLALFGVATVSNTIYEAVAILIVIILVALFLIGLGVYLWKRAKGQTSPLLE